MQANYIRAIILSVRSKIWKSYEHVVHNKYVFLLQICVKLYTPTCFMCILLQHGICLNYVLWVWNKNHKRSIVYLGATIKEVFHTWGATKRSIPYLGATDSISYLGATDSISYLRATKSNVLFLGATTKEVFHTWGQRLFEFLCLLNILDDEGVQVATTAHLELHIVLVLLDLYRCNTHT